jgi:hypothetical protein
MPSTYKLLASATPSGVYSVTFSDIPQTYTDLSIRLNIRSSSAAHLEQPEARLNNYGGFPTYSGKTLGANTNGSSTNIFGSTDSMNTIYCGNIPAASATANIFSNTELYISDYSSPNRKMISVVATSEENANNRGSLQVKGVSWAGSVAVTAFYITMSGTFVSGSIIDIYGIKNS